MKPAHFVIVDDDAINNKLCQFCILRHFGAVPVKSFQNPETALQFIAADYNQHDFTPTVLLLDIHMPQMSGWDFLGKFAEFPDAVQSQFKIYILSSSNDSAQIAMADKHPLVSGFLSKPLSDWKLERVFRELPETYGIKCFN